MVWKKKETDSQSADTTPRPEAPTARPTPAPRRAERAVIGPTLKIQGEISGEEELVIQGQIEGKITVKGQGVTVGKSGKVRADIHAKSIRIEGKVRGDLFGQQDVIIETSGDVEGNLVAPSVRLENGSRFKGSIDMEQTKQTPPRVPAAKPEAASSSPVSAGQPAAGQGTQPSPPGPGHPNPRS